MKREERHHLKDNPLATALARVQVAVQEHGRTLAAAGAGIVLAAVAAGGYFAWQQQRAAQADELLTAALRVLASPIEAPPEAEDGAEAVWEQPPDTFPTDEARLEAALEQFTATADSYPNQPAGVTARSEAAGALVTLGRLDEAAAAWRQVLDAADNPLQATVARLGLAETHILDGDAASAVALLEQESQVDEPAVPVEAVLMRLGHAYELTGQESEALAAFTRVMDEFPLSVYAAQARRRADALDTVADTASAVDEDAADAGN